MSIYLDIASALLRFFATALFAKWAIEAWRDGSDWEKAFYTVCALTSVAYLVQP